MQALPKISIITPSYQQGQYIEETIRSIIDQGYGNLEYIVIDGGSTDSSVEIIKKYEAHITYWVSEKDNGQSDAINKGLKRATGDIVAWLNSDDIYLPGTLQAVADAFVANEKAGIVYGHVDSFFDDGTNQIWENKFEVADFFSRVSIHQPGVFWKRQLHDQLGYLDESFYYLMDYDLWARLFFNTTSISVDRVFARFRVHDEAKTGNNPKGLYLDYRRVLSRFFNSIADTKYKQRMIELGVYSNDEDVKYPIARVPQQDTLLQVFNTYLYNCIIQEYTFGTKASTNKLIAKTLGQGYAAEKVLIWVKNNIGVRALKSNLK